MPHGRFPRPIKPSIEAVIAFLREVLIDYIVETDHFFLL